MCVHITLKIMKMKWKTMHVKEFKEKKELKEEIKDDILFSIHWLITQKLFLSEQGPELIYHFLFVLKSTCEV